MFKKYHYFFFYSKNRLKQCFISSQKIFCVSENLNQDSLFKVFQNNQIVVINIKTTFNNTILTLANSEGKVLTWVSAGSCGFKGARKGTPFAAKKVVENFIKKSNDYLIKCNKIKICICGIGPGRETALRGLEKIGSFARLKKKNKYVTKNINQEKKKPLNEKQISTKIFLIREVTKIPHNGCRPPKKRRL